MKCQTITPHSDLTLVGYVVTGMAAADVGDVVLFNGRCLHRGRANYSDTTRAVLYVSNYKQWYNDDW